MTLASASERVKDMETATGVALLVRNHRGIQVTPAGRTLLHHARSVLQQIDRMQGELSLYGQGLKGHVRLLCNTAALNEYLPDLLSRFLARHPQISVDLEERMSYDIADAIRNDAADIGILADSADLQGLKTHPFCPDPLTLIVPKEHELAGLHSTSLADIAPYDFIGLTEGSALQEHVTYHARKSGKSLHYRVCLSSLDAVCKMVGQGIGIGIVPKATATRLAKPTHIKRISLNDDWANRNLVLCVRPACELPVYVQEMMAFILNH